MSKLKCQMEALYRYKIDLHLPFDIWILTFDINSKSYHINMGSTCDCPDIQPLKSYRLRANGHHRRVRLFIQTALKKWN